MAQKSEQIEDLLADVEDLVAAFYADAVVEAIDASEDKPGQSRVKAAGDIAKAGRAVKLFRGSGARVVKTIAALPRRARDAATDAEETTMNDDSARWTPERIAELHAKVRERLAKFAGSRELKQLVERDLARSDRAMPAQPASSGGPPASSAG
ncbi:MAG: hypothetical protein ACOVOE_11395 [Caulobacter sp.]